MILKCGGVTIPCVYMVLFYFSFLEAVEAVRPRSSSYVIE